MLLYFKVNWTNKRLDNVRIHGTTVKKKLVIWVVAAYENRDCT
jgi:hypothetical protein